MSELRSIGFAFLLVCAACGGSEGPTAVENPSNPPASSPASLPASLSIVSGDQQENVVGSELSSPLVAVVIDQLGDPVPSATVSWVVTAGSGSVFAPATGTTQDGRTQNRWTLGTTSGQNRLEVRWVDPDNGNAKVLGAYQATGVPGAAVTMSLVGQSSRALDLGATDPIELAGEDQYGNPVAHGAIPATWSSDASDIVSVDQTGAAFGAADGVATIQAATAIDTVQVSFRVISGDVLFTDLSQNGDYGCAVLYTGEAFCWGANVHGALGDGSPQIWAIPGPLDRPTPVAVLGGHSFVQIETGLPHTCALTTAGAVHCWGWNQDGVLGPNAPEYIEEPFAVETALTFERLSLGRGAATCGITEAGELHCWGVIGSYSGGGFGSTPIPTHLAPSFVFEKAAHQFNSICGIAIGGSLYCWGDQAWGEVGNGQQAGLQVEPYEVMPGETFADVSRGTDHTCAVTLAGVAYCWGNNEQGQLGDGGTAASYTPVAVSTAVSFRAVTTGEVATCGLSTDGTPYCWGHNSDGRLGVSTQHNDWNGRVLTPQPVVGGHHYEEISAGLGTFCGRTADGYIWCSGRNSSGQVGDGSTTFRTEPTAMKLPW